MVRPRRKLDIEHSNEGIPDAFEWSLKPITHLDSFTEEYAIQVQRKTDHKTTDCTDELADARRWIQSVQIYLVS